MTNPYQEPDPDELTFGEALRAIAERTSFRSEGEQARVLAAIDKHAQGDTQGDTDNRADRHHGDAEDDPGDDPATPGSPTPADTPGAKATPASVRRGGK